MTISPAFGRAKASPLLPVKRRAPLMRRYETQWLDGRGQARVSETLAPATAEFESAFNAFAHGSAIMTPDGPRAVQDLRPGMSVETLEHGTQPVVWIGSMLMVPGAPVEDPDQARLFRIMADRFGPSRPGADLLVGPGARLLHRPAALRDQGKRATALTHLSEFADGESVFAVSPPAPVETFHLCLGRHATIFAEGLGVESFHPGYDLEERLSRPELSLFLNFFPHVDEPADFGLMAHQRLSIRAMLDVDAA